jgi:PAS domain S-box-containing protein
VQTAQGVFGVNDLVGEGTIKYVRLLMDHVPSMMAYWDRDLRCAYANNAYRQWFGVDPGTMVGMSMQDLLGPQLYALNEPYIQAALRGEEQVFERRVPGPGGAQRDSIARYIPHREGGVVAGFMAYVTDVSALKDMQAALRNAVVGQRHAVDGLRRSDSALRQAQRLVHLGSWEWEMVSDVTVWSDELYRIFGRDPARLPPSVAEREKLYAPESWARLRGAVERALESGEAYTLELEFVRPDGTSGWVEARGEVVRDESGVLVGLRGTVQDITARRRVQENFERLDRRKDEFLSTLAHEFRNALASLHNVDAILARSGSLGPAPDRVRPILGRQLRHLDRLVGDMLDADRVRTGRLTLHWQNIDLRDVVARAVEMSMPAIDAAAHELLVDLPETPLVLEGDAVRLTQALNNLLLNAARYTPEPGRIVVRARADHAGVTLSVSDTGIGIPAAQLESIFEIFTRLRRADGPADDGRGVGLAVVREVVQSHGGSVRATSPGPGQGSTLTIWLPVWASEPG